MLSNDINMNIIMSGIRGCGEAGDLDPSEKLTKI